MKKYILSLICIALAVTAYCAKQKTIVKDPAKPIKFSLSFYIAKPKLDCEGGIGVCKLTAGFGRLGGDGREVSGEGMIENGKMTVEIQKNYMESQMEEELARRDYYDVDDDVEIPQSILEKAGLKDSYSIAEGSYRIIKYAEYFEVTFDLK